MPVPDSSDERKTQWRRTANGRLKFELAGVAFARKHCLTPEDYADYLWSGGAAKWMGKAHPNAGEYLLKEADAFGTLYPEVTFDVVKKGEDEAELIFRRGSCLGGWGKNQWEIANSLGLRKGHVCRYCRQAFRKWSKQLGLEACPEPKADGTCILLAKTPT